MTDSKEITEVKELRVWQNPQVLYSNENKVVSSGIRAWLSKF